jgi:hypothetical protein
MCVPPENWKSPQMPQPVAAVPRSQRARRFRPLVPSPAFFLNMFRSVGRTKPDCHRVSFNLYAVWEWRLVVCVAGRFSRRQRQGAAPDVGRCSDEPGPRVIRSGIHLRPSSEWLRGAGLPKGRTNPPLMTITQVTLLLSQSLGRRSRLVSRTGAPRRKRGKAGRAFRKELDSETSPYGGP